MTWKTEPVIWMEGKPWILGYLLGQKATNGMGQMGANFVMSRLWFGFTITAQQGHTNIGK